MFVCQNTMLLAVFTLILAVRSNFLSLVKRQTIRAITLNSFVKVLAGRPRDCS